MLYTVLFRQSQHVLLHGLYGGEGGGGGGGFLVLMEGWAQGGVRSCEVFPSLLMMIYLQLDRLENTKGGRAAPAGEVSVCGGGGGR